MITTSKEYKEKENRIYHAKLNIQFADGTEKELDENSLFGLTINDDVSSADVFSVGAAIINVLTLKLDNSDGFFDDKEFYGAETSIKIGLELDTGTEWLQKGTYIADAGDDVSDVITVKAYDYMRKFDRDYTKSTLGYPATLGAIVRDACQCCGVGLATASFSHDDFVVQNKPEASTFREMLAMVGQISGNWCRINRFGQLEIAFYDISRYEQDTGDFIEISNYLSGSVSTEDVVITGVKVTDGDETYLSGQEGYLIAIEDNSLIQGSGETVAGWLGEKLIGLTFRKISVSHEPDPVIEAGDLARILDRKGNMRKTLLNSITYTFGGTQQSKACAATPLRNSVERFTKSTKNYVKYRELLDNYKSGFDSAVDALGKRLDGASGLFETTEKQTDGSYKYFLHDKPQLKDSTVIMQITSEALAISTDGGKTWPTGITVDGEAIISILKTKGISASWINTGEMVIQDESGKTIFSANKDTGTVLISGDCIRIGDQNLEEALKDTKTLVMQFDCEYATVNVDSEGNYDTFPEITFQPTVYFGAIDVTADCTFTVTASSYVTGKWNSSSRAYTVEGLLADSAWVDVKAVYAKNYIVTKRFTVAKLYAGQKGESAENYFLEVSNEIVVKSKNGMLEPNAVEISAYSRKDGARETYAGYFMIYEVSEDDVKEKVYESRTPESELRYHLYDFLMADTTYPAMGQDNVVISGARSTKMINIELYLDPEKTILLQTKTISYVQKMEELTGEEMFNILTNNGEVQGLYRMNGKIYLNGEYIKSKTVKADAISVDDLYAIGATIGGWSITEDGIVKDIDDADGNTYRVKLRPPYKDNPAGTYILFCAKKKAGEETWSQTFKLRGDGTAFFGETQINTYMLLMGSVGIWNNYYNGKSQIRVGGKMAGSPINYTRGENVTRIYPGSIYVEGTKNNAIGEASFTIGTGGDPVDVQPLTSKDGMLIIDCTRGVQIGSHGNYTSDTGLTYHHHGPHYLIGGLEADTINAHGSKSRIIDTSYGERLLYCYEMPSPMFGDIGEGKTDENGECYVAFDPIFAETIATFQKYYVFIQAESGTMQVTKKENTGFLVCGTANMSFDWEVKAKQIDYGYERLEKNKISSDIEFIDYETEMSQLIEDYITSKENILE